MAGRVPRPLPLVLAAILALGAPAPAQEAGGNPHTVTIKGLSRDAQALAKAGRADDVEDLLAIVEKLGESERALGRTRKLCAKHLGAAGPPKDRVPKVAARLKRAAGDLAAKLGSAPDAEKEALAKLILRLDDEQEAAHLAVGNERLAGEWVTPASLKVRARAEEIQQVVRLAIALEFDIETADSELDYVKRTQDQAGQRVGAHGVSIHSGSVGPGSMKAVLTGLLQAMALSEWLAGRDLAPPRMATPFTVILCGAHDQYARSMQVSEMEGGLAKPAAAIARQTSRFEDSRGFHVVQAGDLAHHKSSLLVELWHHHVQRPLFALPQPCLAAGHLNWLSLHCYARPIPGFVWREGRRDGTSADDTERRASLLQKAKRSVIGAREYLEYLAARRQDPAWSRAIVRNLGEIDGDVLLKCTVVAEYLQQERRFFDLVKKTARKKRRRSSIEAALGHSLADFEEAWRAWLLPVPPGLAQRVGEKPPTTK